MVGPVGFPAAGARQPHARRAAGRRGAGHRRPGRAAHDHELQRAAPPLLVDRYDAHRLLGLGHRHVGAEHVVGQQLLGAVVDREGQELRLAGDPSDHDGAVGVHHRTEVLAIAHRAQLRLHDLDEGAGAGRPGLLAQAIETLALILRLALQPHHRRAEGVHLLGLLGQARLALGDRERELGHARGLRVRIVPRLGELGAQGGDRSTIGVGLALQLGGLRGQAARVRALLLLGGRLGRARRGELAIRLGQARLTRGQGLLELGDAPAPGVRPLAMGVQLAPQLRHRVPIGVGFGAPPLQRLARAVQLALQARELLALGLQLAPQLTDFGLQLGDLRGGRRGGRRGELEGRGRRQPGGAAVPVERLGRIALDAAALLVEGAEVQRGARIALVGGLAVPRRGDGGIRLDPEPLLVDLAHVGLRRGSPPSASGSHTFSAVA